MITHEINLKSTNDNNNDQTSLVESDSLDSVVDIYANKNKNKNKEFNLAESDPNLIVRAK